MQRGSEGRGNLVADHLLELGDGGEDARVDIEGLKPGAEYGNLRPEFVDSGEKGTEEWDHCGFA